MNRSRTHTLLALIVSLGLVVFSGVSLVLLTRQRDLRGQRLTPAELFLRRATGGLTGADLRNADLSNTDLRETALTGSDLRGADLSGADLREAKLVGANLSTARLSRTWLQGARYDAPTRWPQGFDPKSHSARLVPGPATVPVSRPPTMLPGGRLPAP